MGEVASKLSILLHRIAGTGFGLHRMGERKVCTEHLHLLLPLRAAKAVLLTLPLHRYRGGNNVVPALQKMQSHCFASTLSIFLPVGYGPKKISSASCNCKAGVRLQAGSAPFSASMACARKKCLHEKSVPLLSFAGHLWLMRL